MSRILRTFLIGVLLGTFAYTTISVYSLLTEAFSCLKRKDEIFGACKPLLLNLNVPGHLELILAVACSAAGMAGTLTAPGVAPLATVGARRRLITGAQAALVSVPLTAAAAGADSAVRGPLEIVAAALLLLGAWYTGWDTARVWAQLGIAPDAETQLPRPALPRLLARALAGLALAFLGTTVLINLASSPYMGLMRPGRAAVATGIYALAASAFLIAAHYVALRSAWGSRPVVGGRRPGSRWLGACAFLLAVVGGAAVAAPIAAGHAEEVVGQIYGAIRSGPTGATDHQSCRNDPLLCGKPRSVGQPAGTPPPAAHQRSRGGSTVLEVIVRIAIWLIPLIAILALLWLQRRGGPTASVGRLLHMLRDLWQRCRSRSSRLRLTVEMSVLHGVIDQAAAVGLSRRARTEQLSVRLQIVRYYLNALSYARRFGIPRDPGQTPEEFEETLRRRLDSGHAAWSGLTAAFLAARYSPESPSDVELECTRSAWHLARAAIRRAARPAMGRRGRVKIS